LTDVLRSGGAGIENVVRVDQYFRDYRMVNPYHVVGSAIVARSRALPSRTRGSRGQKWTP
jgi:hypothetical protein